MGCVCAGPPPKTDQNGVQQKPQNRRQKSKGNRVGGTQSEHTDAREAARLAAEKRMAALEAKAPAMKKKGSSGTAIARKIKTQDAIKRMDERAARNAEVAIVHRVASNNDLEG